MKLMAEVGFRNARMPFKLGWVESNNFYPSWMEKIYVKVGWKRGPMFLHCGTQSNSMKVDFVS